MFDEKRAINRVSVWVSMLRHKMEKEYSREWLETELRKGLREGRLSLTIKAVEAADNGDEIADAALREVGAELQMQLLQKRDLAPGHLQVIAYLQRAAKRAPHKRPRGRRWYDDWVRNIHICLLIVLACREFGVRASRNRAARRANKGEPSALALSWPHWPATKSISTKEACKKIYGLACRANWCVASSASPILGKYTICLTT